MYFQKFVIGLYECRKFLHIKIFILITMINGHYILYTYLKKFFE
jgi:predicted MFS family arabinose efflux permease